MPSEPFLNLNPGAISRVSENKISGGKDEKVFGIGSVTAAGCVSACRLLREHHDTLGADIAIAVDGEQPERSDVR
jgi:hypothetical protein